MLRTEGGGDVHNYVINGCKTTAVKIWIWGMGGCIFDLQLRGDNQ
jgi:hypothetical protein